MSFIRAFFLKPKTKKSASLDVEANRGNDEVDTAKNSSTEDEDGDDDNDDKTSVIDVYKLETKLLNKKESLDTSLKNYLKGEKKICRLQKQIIRMNKELMELHRMLRQTNLQRNGIEAEVDTRKEKLKLFTGLAILNADTEIKAKEPLLYKKYNHIKTTGDAKSLLSAIKNKQKCLQHLELLTFKKYLNNQHDLKKDGRLQASGDKLLEFTVPVKPEVFDKDAFSGAALMSSSFMWERYDDWPTYNNNDPVGLMASRSRSETSNQTGTSNNNVGSLNFDEVD